MLGTHKNSFIGPRLKFREDLKKPQHLDMEVLLYFDSRLPDGGARNFHGAEMPRVGL